MCESEGRDDSLEEMARSIAREVGRSVERAMEKIDLEGFADVVGVDPAAAREWVAGAGGWLRARAEDLSAEAATPSAETSRAEDSLRSAAPHPLDPPTEEQGLALAALDSGRWMVEPGTDALAAKGEGPGPRDALGIVRELRVRDWIAGGGELTLAGRRALSRWLDAATAR